MEVDIRKFFDTLDHKHLRAFLQRRVQDGVVLRLIGKWLNAGVLEEGVVTHPSEGSPQGGVISPPTVSQSMPPNRAWCGLPALAQNNRNRRRSISWDSRCTGARTEAEAGP